MKHICDCGNHYDSLGALEACQINNHGQARLQKRPVAWRVRDCADGWIIYQNEEAAYWDAEQRGAQMQGLYVRDGC